MSLRFALLACLFASPVVAADNWPQFRGPNGDGLSDAKSLPTKWSETENVRWKTAIHDKGWSSPVIWKDQVWVTTAHEDGTSYYAICIDRKTGRVVHDLHLFDVSPAPHPISSTSPLMYPFCWMATRLGCGFHVSQGILPRR